LVFVSIVMRAEKVVDNNVICTNDVSVELTDRLKIIQVVG